MNVRTTRNPYANMGRKPPVPRSKSVLLYGKSRSKSLIAVKPKIPSKTFSVDDFKEIHSELPPWRMKAPFKISTKRFMKIGFHPDLDPQGHFVVRLLGPGQYHPERADNAFKYKRGVEIEDWKRKQLSEEFSKNMGYKHPEIQKRRLFDKASRGPGTHDINEEFSCQCAEASRDKGFGLQERCRIYKSDTPGPGNFGAESLEIVTNDPNVVKSVYGKNHVPDTRIHEAKLNGSTKTPTMEFAGFGSRFKEVSPNWALAPNRYHPKDSNNIDALLKKTVSRRGPYDLFTGPRDGTTIKNHFAPPKFVGPKTDFYEMPRNLEYLLHHHRKRHYGVFLRAKRFTKKPTLRIMLDDMSLTYRNPHDPGPASYKNTDLGCIKKLPEQKFAFGESIADIWPGVKWTIFPGPGRYSPQKIECPYSNKQASWVFKSVVPRPQYKYQEYGYFF